MLPLALEPYHPPCKEAAWLGLGLLDFNLSSITETEMPIMMLLLSRLKVGTFFLCLPKRCALLDEEVNFPLLLLVTMILQIKVVEGVSMGN